MKLKRVIISCYTGNFPQVNRVVFFHSVNSHCKYLISSIKSFPEILRHFFYQVLFSIKDISIYVISIR